jgi:hypothetical protein
MKQRAVALVAEYLSKRLKGPDRSRETRRGGRILMAIEGRRDGRLSNASCMSRSIDRRSRRGGGPKWG